MANTCFFTPVLLLFGILAALPAQARKTWARTVEPSADHSIFQALELPTPNRMRTAAGAPGQDYWQQEANYKIAVELVPEQRLVKGSEHVTYVNHSPDALDYIWVHLEQNALRKDSLCGLTEGSSLMGGATDNSDGVIIGELRSLGKPLAYQVYDTLMRVELPNQLAPGGILEFDCAWQFEVPQHVFRRYGTMDTKKGIIWEIAQWFPAVAVYDDVHGWNTLPYIGGAEFYTNHGTYDVSITAPRAHIVVATGVLQNGAEVYTAEQQKRIELARKSEETVAIIATDEVGTKDSRPAGSGPLTWKFHAEKVRTFAWASSPAFILDAAALGETLCQSAYPAECSKVWSKSTQMIRKALAGYSKRWLAYPYPMATNVAGVEGGMEYPMIVFCAAGGNERGLYGVTSHEFGHTWFPMVVNTDERRHAWMDEGFNTFINIYSDEDWFGKIGRPSSGMGGGSMPIDTPADQLSQAALGALEYFKTGAGLYLLREHILGPERFDYAFRTYIRRWAFKSPRPADFFRTMEDAAGADLAWFFRGWFLEPAKLDQAIDLVRAPTESKSGSVVITNLDRMVMPIVLRITYADDSQEELRLPVQIWHSSNRVTQSLAKGKLLKKVELDPFKVFPDAARANNTWTPDAKAPAEAAGEKAPTGGGEKGDK